MGPVRRRTFLSWAIAGVIAAVLAAVAAITAIVLTPAWPVLPGIRLPKRLADLVEGDVIPIRAPTDWAFVMADGGGNNHSGDLAHGGFVVRVCGKTEVFAANCSHLGCTLAYSSERFVCPCHGSTYETACAIDGKSIFAIDGAVVRGPATFPMSHINWGRTPRPDEISLKMVRSTATKSG